MQREYWSHVAEMSRSSGGDGGAGAGGGIRVGGRGCVTDHHWSCARGTGSLLRMPAEPTGLPEIMDARGAPTKADPRRWVTLGVMCLALLVVGIDGTIVNVALPSLVRELGASSTELQWIVDAYTIVFASFLLIAGSTGDRLGRKRCFLVGLGIFGIGSAACALADTPDTLIAFRAIQGLGAAFIMPATLSILTNSFREPIERRRAIALWAGVSGLGVAIGPLAGGYLLVHYWWGSIFWVNIPLVIAAVVAALILVPESHDPSSPRPDLVGAALSTIGLIALLFGIIEGPNQGWAHPLILGAFALAAALLVGFVLWERTTDHPLLDLSFFADARFSAASIAVTFVFFSMFGSVFFASQYLQFVLGYSPFKSGAALLPVAGALMVSAPLSANLVGRLGTKIVVTVGLALVALGLYLFSFATATSGYGPIAGMLVVIGLGMGLAMAPATDSIMGSLPPEKAGVGSAVNDTTRQVGGALGVAVLGSITTALYAAKITSHPQFDMLQTASPQAAEAVQNSVGAAAIVAERLPPDAARLLENTANAAFVSGASVALVVGALVTLGGALVALAFLPARPRATDAVDRLVTDASLHLPRDPEQRLHLARSALELFAEAGMSSLTYHAVAARSGIGTATLERHWTSRVDAVTDALAEIIAAYPVPDTGDLRGDLRTYLRSVADLLADDDARAVLRTLVAEAGNDAALAAAVRNRVLAPWAHELTRRLRNVDRLNVAVDHAFDQIMGPLYARALLVGPPPDHDLVDAIVATVTD